MSDPRWQRLQALFGHLLTLDAAEREAWLAAAEPDATLRREALALAALDADGTHGGITDRMRAAAASVATPAAALPRSLGAYRLLEEIGSGGMGTVFLAERDDQGFRQRVAIKLLRGMPTREAAERMRRERQILADLAHPHIALLLDGGQTPDGQPYLVMEHVEGMPIDAYCRSRALGTVERLRLIAKICGAVQFAHARLVVHRDLKPGNVLVRADGEPVLLDFGIAKLLGASDAEISRTSLPWLTPAYASPEQRRGESVGTAADVYGLGALLYAVLADTPPPTHARLPRLRTSSARGARRLPAELDLIIAKATQAQAEQRYASAAALADDLQRHLRGLPLQAAPDRLHYRFAKFLARHRIATAAAFAAGALAIAFAWRLADERDRAVRAEALAQAQSATAERVIDYLVALFRPAASQDAGAKPITPRELVDRGRREIDRHLVDAPLQQARLLGALGGIYVELGVPDEAADSYAAAAELERQHGTPRRRAAYLAEQGQAHNLDGDMERGETVLREALAEFERLAPTDPGALADALSSLSLAQARNGDPAAALISAERARDYARSSDGENSTRFGQALYTLAEAELRQGRTDQAEAYAKRSVDVFRRLTSEDSPEVLASTGFLTTVYEQQERYAEAEALLRRMLDVYLRSLSPDSSRVITARNNLANVIYLQERPLEAAGLFRQNIDHLRRSGQQDSATYPNALNNLASVLEQAGDYAASVPLFEEVVRRAAGAGNAVSEAIYRQNLGRSLLLAGRLDAAWPLISADVEGSTDSFDLNLLRARQRLHMAEWKRRAGRLDDADADLARAGTQFSALFPADNPRHGAVARTRALVLRDRKRLAEAEAEFRRAIAIFGGGGRGFSNTLIETELQLADLLSLRGARDEARAIVDRVAPALPARFVESAPAWRDFAALRRRLGTS